VLHFVQHHKLLLSVNPSALLPTLFGRGLLRTGLRHAVPKNLTPGKSLVQRFIVRDASSEFTLSVAGKLAITKSEYAL